MAAVPEQLPKVTSLNLLLSRESWILPPVLLISFLRAGQVRFWHILVTAPLSLTATSYSSFCPPPPPGRHGTFLCLKLHNPERANVLKSFCKLLVTYLVDISVLVTGSIYRALSVYLAMGSPLTVSVWLSADWLLML